MSLRTLREDRGRIMLFCARLGVLINLLRKHRHLYPPRCFKLVISLLLCLFLQISIKREDKFYKEHVDHIDLKDDPVFITGHWRSGTTYLHYLMGLDVDNFAYPTSYQCLFPTIFLTVNEKSWWYKLVNKIIGTGIRRIDNMKFALALLQEEEWMYLPEGGFSYMFENMIFPETCVSNYGEIIKSSNDAKNKEVTLKIFKKLTFAHNKRILSKSPGHFSRIHTLKEPFPKSKFIFLIRHPYDVVMSMIHMRNILRKIASLQKFSAEEASCVAKFLTFCFNTIEDSLAMFDHTEYMLVKYEYMIHQPIKCIEEIYNKFDFKYTADYETSLTTYLNSLKDYQRNKFEITSNVKGLIYKECSRIFHEYGYER
jgi:omega-hydroxy-beta-dihydromenaquinone-9 sulfotransferase